MLIKIDAQIQFEVTFEQQDREEDYDDDIRFAIHERAPSDLRLFGADTTSLLLTPEQAEQLAQALLAAVEASRSTPQ